MDGSEYTSSLLINVNDLLSLQGVEKQRVEFKEAWHAEKTHNRGTYWQVVHTICAFANDFYNDNGGYLIIGVKEKENWEEDTDDRQIVLPPCGVAAKDLERIQKEIIGACRANLRPEYLPILSPEVVDGKHVLVVWATASDNRPHQCRESNKGEFCYYIRRATETVKASPNEIRQLMEQHSKIPFDDRKANDNVNGRQFSEDDIDASLVKKYLQEVSSNHRHQKDGNLSLLYQTLELVRSIGDKRQGDRLVPILVPRNVALLFFNSSPHKYLSGAKSEIATYNHDDVPIDEKPLTGPIDRQIKETLSYILENTKEEVSSAFVTYPERALREAVVNAFYHRGYEPENNEPVKVHIYPNYIDVISYPGPLPSLKLEHFKDGKEIPPVRARNRRIGELLKERKLAEGRGSGVKTIFRAMKQNKSPCPSFLFDETFFRVRLPGHPNYIAHALCNEIDNLCAKGEKDDAVELLKTFLEENPDMVSERLVVKLLKLHDDDKNHPNVQPYQQHISERLERRLPLISDLCKWSVSEDPLDITHGVKIVKDLMKEGATCDDFHSVIMKAASLCQAKGPNAKPVLQPTQNAHKLFEAMGKANQTNPYVAYQFACCKYNLYMLNMPGLAVTKRKELVPYLKEAEDYLQMATQLTSKEQKHNLANQYRQLGLVHYQLLSLRKSTVKEVIEFYDKAREYNPQIKINRFNIPQEYVSRYMESPDTS